MDYRGILPNIDRFPINIHLDIFLRIDDSLTSLLLMNAIFNINYFGGILKANIDVGISRFVSHSPRLFHYFCHYCEATSLSPSNSLLRAVIISRVRRQSVCICEIHSIYIILVAIGSYMARDWSNPFSDFSLVDYNKMRFNLQFLPVVSKERVAVL